MREVAADDAAETQADPVDDDDAPEEESLAQE
jgi:hypothetical protein